MDNENNSYTNIFVNTFDATGTTGTTGTTRTSNTTATSNTHKESLASVMKDLEEKVNPKSVEESIKMLATAIATKDPSIILNPLQAGAKEFEERVGRPMSYSEMRAMWG